MSILFFTPTIIASAIGRVSKLVVAELLRQGHEVTVIRAEDPSLFADPMHAFSCEIVPWNRDSQIRQLIDRSELIVYQIGNHYLYHRGCVEWLPTASGIVCLHDNFLGHLFWSWSEARGRDKAVRLLTTLYGPEVADRFFNHSNSTSFIAYANQCAPMTEWIASMATAVLVHSNWAINRIVRACNGPVKVIPLPYDAPFLEMKDHQLKDNDHIIVSAIGHVNENKRHASVIAAIAANRLLREKISFRIVGPVEPVMAQNLSSLASSLDVKIVITGSVDDRRLAEEIQMADIMSCLRWPSLEAASASAIEGMLYGKPILVTNTGFYRDLPNDCVVKISMDSELSDVGTALEKLVLLPKERMALGRLAQYYAAKTFRADAYANSIIAIESCINQTKTLFDAAGFFSDALKRWGATGDPVLMDPIILAINLIK